MSNAAAVVSRLIDELTERRVRELLTELLLATTVTPAPAKAKPAAVPAVRSVAPKPTPKAADEKTSAEQLRPRRQNMYGKGGPRERPPTPRRRPSRPRSCGAIDVRASQKQANHWRGRRGKPARRRRGYCHRRP
jgi:hypothetical protein